MKHIHTIHLVQDEDRSKKACDGTPYKTPEAQQGDLIVLCQLCANPTLRKKPDA